ncbi:MAG: hypothetical protein HYX69_01575 [Planctomycetia bacterium]|nr:hypothetical protein [Planctomycetia bacterium]
MSRVIAIMVTMTTYGTWLRGDARGWVDRGVVMPADPGLEHWDARRLKHTPFVFGGDQCHAVGDMIGTALVERLRQRMLALAVRSWHVHFVVGSSSAPIVRVVKCAKDAVRWGLRPGRPIWTDGYDKRYCFDEESTRRRVEYVERHNVERGCAARPWAFIEPFDG